MGKEDKEYFKDNEGAIWEALLNAYHDFQGTHCEMGFEMFVPFPLYQAAFFDYLKVNGLEMEQRLWSRFKEGFLLVQLDKDIDITNSTGTAVVLGKKLKSWPRGP